MAYQVERLPQPVIPAPNCRLAVQPVRQHVEDVRLHPGIDAGQSQRDTSSMKARVLEHLIPHAHGDILFRRGCFIRFGRIKSNI